ncbi:MAG: MutS2/Smr-associated SH3 domain-containing protein [Phycisphaerae bacterium]
MDAHSLECLDFARITELVASYALTGLGRALAAGIQPISRPELIRRWLAQVDELDRLEPQRGLPPFGGVSDVRELVKNCAPPLHVAAEDVARIGDTLLATHHIGRYLAGLPENFPELGHLQQRIGDFRTLGQRIRVVIDERGQVRSEASPKLARVRAAIEGAQHEIHTTMERLLHDPNIRRFLQYPNFTLHADRMVLPLRTECRGRVQGIIHRTSDSGATLYVEPGAAVELNNQIANLRIEEQEEINRLLWELAHEVYLNAKEILRTLDGLAVLDLIVAKLRYARDYALICPDLDDHARVHVRQARHPLLLHLQRTRPEDAAAPGEIVPISYRLGEDFTMLLITGPNTGGKTVTLKTVGLISLMVQAGLPAPVAPGSTVGVFNEILIDVGDEQSMQQSLSTFSAHLKRHMEMLRRAGPRTLLLIDELGAGTDPDEGAAIGRAVLDEILRLDGRCMVTTHLGALKGYALTRDRAENACVEFDIETLRPTYRLRIGEAGLSNAIAVAEKLGMPKRLVIAARRNLSRRSRAMTGLLEGTAVAKREAEQAREAAVVARLGADRAAADATAARDQWERQRLDFQTWLQRVVHLRPGDAVRVRNFDRDGKIVRMRLDQQRAEVDVGAFSVEVPLADVLPPETPPPPPRPFATRPDVIPTGRAARMKPGREPLRERAGSEPARTPPDVAGLARPPLDQRGPRRPRTGEAPPHDHRGAGAPRRDRGSDGARPQPRIEWAPLTDAQVEALKPGDKVIVKRFHREGTVVRVNLTKHLVTVSAGLLDVEVPYNGLAQHVRPEPPPKPPPPKRPPTVAANTDAPPAAAPPDAAPAAASDSMRAASDLPSDAVGPAPPRDHAAATDGNA